MINQTKASNRRANYILRRSHLDCVQSELYDRLEPNFASRSIFTFGKNAFFTALIDLAIIGKLEALVRIIESHELTLHPYRHDTVKLQRSLDSLIQNLSHQKKGDLPSESLCTTIEVCLISELITDFGEIHVHQKQNKRAIPIVSEATPMSDVIRELKERIKATVFE